MGLRRRRAGIAGTLVTVTLLCGLSGCISGRVLSGYPGYPFLAFSVPGPSDTTFFRMQVALDDEGYAIDYTDRESGLINTRVGRNAGRPVHLSVVIGDSPEGPADSDIWVAGFERTRSGVRRINPLDEELWAVVVEISTRLSERFGGTEPIGPDERARAEQTPRP